MNHEYKMQKELEDDNLWEDDETKLSHYMDCMLSQEGAEAGFVKIATIRTEFIDKFPDLALDYRAVY